MGSFDILNSYYLGSDSPQETFYATVVMILSNVTLNVGLIYLFGLVGAAVATFISFSIASVYLFLRTPSVVSAIELKVVFKGAMSALLMGMVVMLVQKVVTPIPEPSITVGVTVAIGGAAFTVPLLLLLPRLRARVVTTLL
jgi:O-antigen/teichoic acid export membrane protein